MPYTFDILPNAKKAGAHLIIIKVCDWDWDWLSAWFGGFMFMFRVAVWA